MEGNVTRKYSSNAEKQRAYRARRKQFVAGDVETARSRAEAERDALQERLDRANDAILKARAAVAGSLCASCRSAAAALTPPKL